MCHLAKCQKYKYKHKWDIAFFLNDVYVLVALISVNFLPLMSTCRPFFIDGQSGLSLNTELSHYSGFVYTLTHNIKSKPLHSDLTESLGRHVAWTSGILSLLTENTCKCIPFFLCKTIPIP